MDTPAGGDARAPDCLLIIHGNIGMDMPAGGDARAPDCLLIIHGNIGMDTPAGGDARAPDCLSQSPAPVPIRGFYICLAQYRYPLHIHYSCFNTRGLSCLTYPISNNIPSGMFLSVEGNAKKVMASRRDADIKKPCGRKTGSTPEA